MLEVAEALRGVRDTVQVRMTQQDVLNHLSFEVDATRLRATGWHPRRALDEALGEMLAHFTGMAPLARP